MTCRDRRGGVPPPPRQPHPHGAILHGYTARERSSLCRQCEHSHRNPAPAPRTRYPGQSPNTCPPRERFPATREDRGRGVPPPPRQPLPTGAILHRYSATGGDHFSAVSVNTLLKSSSSPRTRYPGQSPNTCPPPLEGAGGGRGSGRAVGVFPATREDRGRGVPPPPRQPLPHGGDIP